MYNISSMKEMTDRQKEIYDWIVSETRKNRFQPSYSEIAAKFKITKKAVMDRLTAISRRGLIELPKGQARSIKFKEFGDSKWIN